MMVMIFFVSNYDKEYVAWVFSLPNTFHQKVPLKVRCDFTYRDNSIDDDQDGEDLSQKTAKQGAPQRSNNSK